MGSFDKGRLRGSITPIVTPFRNDEVDYTTLARLVDFQIENGSHGVSVTGTTGEPSSLTAEEREAVIETTVKAARGRVPVVVGTGSVNHAETLRFTKFAQKVGADAALVIVPYYNKPSQSGLYQHFRAVAENVPDYPLILYNIPGRTSVNLNPDTIAKLAKDCPNIIGVKESNTNFAQVSEVLYRTGRDFLLYSGIEALCYPMLTLGGSGHVSATANILPREVADIYNLCAASKWEEARELHYRLLPLNEVLFVETNPGPLKYAMGLMGLIEPELRLPMALPSPENQAKIRSVMKDYGLLG